MEVNTDILKHILYELSIYCDDVNTLLRPTNHFSIGLIVAAINSVFSTMNL